ncbi:hypothetical protein ACFWOT_09130 [Streptomyces sp. NPDC058440]|uniref:hypothetical protein n=1 Tax=Streptomyces sp. NPDC058440 TaxID=3346501 RepID=UPI0036606F3D
MTKTIHVPGQIRRHVLKQGKPSSSNPGKVHLYAACQEGDNELKRKGMNTLNTIELHMTNAAMGAALDIARSWLDSDNGNNVMAAKSMLKYELEYEPADPREIRHEIKMPKSLAGEFDAPWTSEFKNSKRIPKAVKADIREMSWTGTGASGRVRAEALGWFLEKARYFNRAHPTSSVQRSAKKFVETYTEPYEKTQRLITGYLGIDEDQGQAPEPVKDDTGTLSADGFKALIHGQGPELEEVEPATEDQAKEEEKDEPAAVEETPMPRGGFEVPVNFLELAEEGNTPQARAYWKRRCEEYRRTGK